MNDAVCQLYYGKGILGKLLCAILKLLLKISDWKGKPNLNVLFNYNMPIRRVCKNDRRYCDDENGRGIDRDGERTSYQRNSTSDQSCNQQRIGNIDKNEVYKLLNMPNGIAGYEKNEPFMRKKA